MQRAQEIVLILVNISHFFANVAAFEYFFTILYSATNNSLKITNGFLVVLTFVTNVLYCLLIKKFATDILSYDQNCRITILKLTGLISVANFLTNFIVLAVNYNSLREEFNKLVLFNCFILLTHIIYVIPHIKGFAFLREFYE